MVLDTYSLLFTFRHDPDDNRYYSSSFYLIYPQQDTDVGTSTFNNVPLSDDAAY